jgi:LuxR family transcriptional regulator/LuxR family quorum-sensing system transcriptional regulator CciR
MDLRDFEAAVDATVVGSGELWALCRDFFHARGVVRMTYHHLPPLGAPDGGRVLFRADGFPEDLVARYVAERLWRENPMLRHAMSHPEPFYWSEVARSAELSEGMRAYLDQLERGGALEGLGIEVYGPLGRNGYCGLGLPRDVAPLPPAEVRDLQRACQVAHLRYCGHVAERIGAPPELSRRERQVLDWVARGKSNSSIGEILGISAHTVDAHLRRIFLKLDVGDRISATLRGLGVGLIHAIP